MGDLTSQKRRLELHKEFLNTVGNWNFNPENLKLAPGYDSKSLERAAAFFELDRADPSQLLVLTHILADVSFGQRKPGPRRGVKTIWDQRNSWELVWAYTEERNRHPHCSDGKIAKLISERKEFKAYKNDPETIRKKLPEVMKFGLSDDYGIWESALND